MKILFFFLFFSFLSTQVHAKDFSEKELKKLGPQGFLKYLRTHCCAVVTVMTAPKNWIKQNDVTALKRSLNDNRPAAPVMSRISSIRCDKPSTVKNEAKFLLLGFKEKRYPPQLASCLQKP